MIKILREHFEEPSGRLKVEIEKLRDSIVHRMSRINFMNDGVDIEHDYAQLRVQLDVLEFLEYYLFGENQKNWLITEQAERPVKFSHQMKKIIKNTMDSVLKRKPGWGLKYSSVYFTALYYLNKIEVEEEDYGS